VFTVDASSPGSAQQSFITIAKACGTDPNDRAAKSFLSSSDRPWLLIIDNADDINLDIDRYFPDGEHGLILITTRNESVKMHGTIGQRFYHFDRLNDDEASELLLRAASNFEPRTPKIRKLASAITKKLGSLPLALIHAGNAIKAKYCELSNYIAYYERSWQIIRQSHPATGDEDEDDAEYMKVYASYEIVFRGLESIKTQRYRDAVQILKIFSFFHHESIPFEVLTAAIRHPRIQREANVQGTGQVEKRNTGLSKVFKNVFESIWRKQFENQNPVILPTFIRDAELSGSSDDGTVRLHKALYLLTQLSLITHYEDSDSYSMHPLVHIWVRERPQMTAPIQAVWCEAALHTLSRCILLPPLNEKVDPQGHLARKLLPHLISVGKLQQKIKEELLNNQEKRRRPWPALETRISPWRAMFLAKSAVSYSECGLFSEAEACLRLVLDFNRGFLGPNHPRTERVALTISDCLWQQCLVNEAAEIQEQLLESNMKTLGSDHPRTLRLMDKLGESRRHQGRLAESIELLTKALDGFKSQLSDTDPVIYHALEQLGITLRVCFRFEDARRYQEQAVEGMKQYVGKENLSTLITIEQLAITYKELSTVYLDSNKALAQQYLETAHKHASFVLEQRISQLGEKQPHTWMAQGTLGRIKAAMGHIEEAETMFATLLPVAIRHLGPDHLEVLSHQAHHCKILIQQGRYQEAEACLVNISRPARYKTVISKGDHPDRWDALWTLVDCYHKQEKIELSLATCNELLDAVGAIRQGKEQTEISSIFWELILAKRVDLIGMMESDVGQDSSSLSPNSLSGNSGTVVFKQDMQARGSQVDITRVGKDLRLRGTW
jgi:tetratricopeptide (TPR) repeat protein